MPAYTPTIVTIVMITKVRRLMYSISAETLWLEPANNSAIPVITPKYGMIVIKPTHSGQSQSLTRGRTIKIKAIGIENKTMEMLTGLPSLSIPIAKKL